MKENNELILDDVSRRKMQMIQLEMLIEVDRICRKYDIPYSMDGGTLLGAIRHKGFIPWDPDIDVIMLRRDYEKFFTVAEQELDKERFFLQERRTDKEYRWGFPKIRRHGTEYVRKGQEHLRMKTGIFMDILVMDNVPDNKIERKFFLRFCTFCRWVMWSEVGKYETSNKKNQRIYKFLNHIPIGLIFKQLQAVTDHYNKKTTELVRYTTCRYTYNKSLIGIPVSYFNEYDEYLFEGHYFKGFKDYDSYLTLLYGNYMELPPVEKRVSHMPLSKLKFL